MRRQQTAFVFGATLFLVLSAGPAFAGDEPVVDCSAWLSKRAGFAEVVQKVRKQFNSYLVAVAAPNRQIDCGSEHEKAFTIYGLEIETVVAVRNWPRPLTEKRKPIPVFTRCPKAWQPGATRLVVLVPYREAPQDTVTMEAMGDSASAENIECYKREFDPKILP